MTSFGRARLDLQDFSCSLEEPIVLSTNNDPPQIAADKVEELSFQEEAEVKCHNSESKTGQILDYNIRSQWIKKLKFITMLL